MAAEADETDFRVELEYTSAELTEMILRDMQVRGESAALIRMVARVRAALRPSDLERSSSPATSCSRSTTAAEEPAVHPPSSAAPV
jgi:hypothetical protein